MKTTIELADDLAAQLKRISAQEGISLRTAVHESLRLWLQQRPTAAPPPPILPNVGLVAGEGLSVEARGRNWDDLRALSYEP